ncbi:hypothetical protein LCGC14_1587290 [marine sediment metagenome]|uniref:Uncharacterized protein n=1 Tax=marine sediment metagenome TaxID=412755 RepID=A0A0F9IFD4_9ZZZZ
MAGSSSARLALLPTRLSSRISGPALDMRGWIENAAFGAALYVSSGRRGARRDLGWKFHDARFDEFQMAEQFFLHVAQLSIVLRGKVAGPATALTVCCYAAPEGTGS